MEITITLTDKEQQFLQWMITESKYETITTIDQAIHECIAINIFDEGEHFS